MNVALQIGQTESTFALNYSYFYKNVNGRVFTMAGVALTNFFINVFENPNTGANAGCIFFSGILHGGQTANQYTKFVNSNVCLLLSDGVGHVSLRHGRDFNKLILSNCNYYIRKGSTNQGDYATLIFNLKFPNIYGTPVTRWFYDSMYEFVNVISGRNIQITGLIYPESEQNLSSALTNNTTTNIIVGNKLQNRSMVIDYTIVRGTGFRSGSFRIINDGTALYMSPDEFVTNGDAGVSDVAIVLTANYNTNEIRVAALLDNGVAGTFTYNISRVMITPLTI